MKKLPIGIQTFSEIITNNYVYADKTKEALELINNYKYVFLSRPRRFGKSLFLDTLNEIFSGNKELFKNLYIYNRYDFTEYPIIRISWGGDFKTPESTEEVANQILKENQERLGIECENRSSAMCFRELIQKSYKIYRKPAVVLIDEYDKPILDNLENKERALQNRDFLRAFYVQLKESDRYIRFAFLTGISKFSKASIFSGLNNLEDISLHPDFGNICGYTQDNLSSVFKEHLKGSDHRKVKEWYNGYYYLKDQIYNPFDILKFIKNKFTFNNYWWESGNPFSLIKLLKEGNYFIPELENLMIDNTLLNSFDIENLRLESLLFQAGYLTIDGVEEDEEFGTVLYKLKVPNKEIQLSLNNLLFDYLTSKNPNIQYKKTVLSALENSNFKLLRQTLVSLFSSIPYTNYVNNTISSYEGYYASVIYTYLASLGLKLIAEDITNTGRIDLTLMIKDKVYIIEFKVVRYNSKDSLNALYQIKEKRYYEKYLDKNKQIYLIGIEFDEEKRNIEKMEWEKI